MLYKIKYGLNVIYFSKDYPLDMFEIADIAINILKGARLVSMNNSLTYADDMNGVVLATLDREEPWGYEYTVTEVKESI